MAKKPIKSETAEYGTPVTKVEEPVVDPVVSEPEGLTPDANTQIVLDHEGVLEVIVVGEANARLRSHKAHGRNWEHTHEDRHGRWIYREM